MEALLFMFDALVMVALVFMGLRDDRRAPGAPMTSLFRTRDEDTPRTAAAPSAAAAPWDPRP